MQLFNLGRVENSPPLILHDVPGGWMGGLLHTGSEYRW